MSEALAILEAESPRAFLRQAPPPTIEKPMKFGLVPTGAWFRVGHFTFKRLPIITDKEPYDEGAEVISAPREGPVGEIWTFDYHSVVYPTSWSPEKAQRPKPGNYGPVGEEESPKGLMRMLHQPFSDYLTAQNFVLSHHNWWVKRVPRGPAELSGLFWLEHYGHAPDDPVTRWLKIVFHLLRPDRTPWQTFKVTQPDVADKPSFQEHVRLLVDALLRDCTSAVRNAMQRELGASDTDESRQAVGEQVAAAFRRFEASWMRMADLVNQEPI